MQTKITVECPSCHARLRIGANHAGKTRRCPRCKATVRVPDGDEDSAYENESELDAGTDAEELADLNNAGAFNLGAEYLPAEEPVSDGVDGGLNPWADEVPTFKERTARLGSELREEIAPTRPVPDDVRKLVADGEAFLFAGNPSESALMLKLFFGGIAALVVNPGLPMFTWNVIAGLVVTGAWVLFILYLLYMNWKTQFYAITSKRIIVRTGWFNHIIRMAPLHNIQCVTINSGWIDRWLGLNSIIFETASAGGFGAFRLGVLLFANIHSDAVMAACRESLGSDSAF